MFGVHHFRFSQSNIMTLATLTCSQEKGGNRAGRILSFHLITFFNNSKKEKY